MTIKDAIRWIKAEATLNGVSLRKHVQRILIDYVCAQRLMASGKRS